MTRCHQPLPRRPDDPYTASSLADRAGGRIPAPACPVTTANRPSAPPTAPIPLAKPSGPQPTAGERVARPALRACSIGRQGVCSAERWAAAGEGCDTWPKWPTPAPPARRLCVGSHWGGRGRPSRRPRRRFVDTVASFSCQAPTRRQRGKGGHRGYALRRAPVPPHLRNRRPGWCPYGLCSTAGAPRRRPLRLFTLMM